MATERAYFAPHGDLPPQTAMITSKAVLRSAYAIIPASSITDNVRSTLPGWHRTRCWILAAPAIGLSTGFAEYLIYLDHGGECEEPEVEPGVEGFLFVLDGGLSLTVKGQRTDTLGPGGFAFIAPNTAWSVQNHSAGTARFLWLRKVFEPWRDMVPGLIINHEQNVPIAVNPTSDQKWTTNLIPTDDLAYDMHMNIVSFGPGTIISAIETHVMEHGLYMLQGKGVYLLNNEWYEVQAGDFIWMKAFCPQAFVASGPGPARYLLYKNVNRQVALQTSTALSVRQAR